MNRRGRVPDALRPAQDYLNSARHTQMELDALREMRARLREHATMRCRPDRWAIPERKTKQEYRDDLEQTEKAMFKVEETLEKQYRAVFDMIASVPDETVRTVLELRYIACKPIFVIARKTNYCDRQVYRLQTIGLMWVKGQLEKKEREAEKEAAEREDSGKDGESGEAEENGNCGETKETGKTENTKKTEKTE